MTNETVADALIRAGVELLEETGSEDVSLRAIARRAGVSHGAPRNWFPTHAYLLAAIARSGLQDLAVMIRSRAQEAPDARQAVEAAAVAYVEFAVTRPAMFALMFRHDILAGAGGHLRDLSVPLLQWLQSTIATATETDGDARTRSTLLWTNIHGIAVLASRRVLDLAAPDMDALTLVEHSVAAYLD